MSAIVNDRDLQLQATSPRLVPVDLVSVQIPALKGITLITPGVNFQVTAGGTPSPAAYVVTANLVQISGTVSFSVTSGSATLTGSGNSRTISYSNVVTFPVTIRASCTDTTGTVYTSDVTFTKVQDGGAGKVFKLQADSNTFKVDAVGTTFSPASINLTAVLTNITGTVSFTVLSGTATLTGTGNTRNLAFADLGTTTAQLQASVTEAGVTYTDTVTISKVQDGATGSSGPQNSFAYLYQWSPTTPSNPNGASTYTWATGASSAYTGTGSWSPTVPSNPGTPGLHLWRATKAVSAASGTTTTSVSWAAGFAVEDITANGTATQNASPTVYEWAATIPTGPTGTSTYTWATGGFTPVPSGWSSTPGTSPSAGFTLWAAKTQLIDATGAATSTINWTTASIVAVGYAGTNGNPGSPGSAGSQGASARIAYTKTTLTSLASTPSTITTAGNSSFPAANSWGTGTSWSGTPSSLAAGESLYQSDGIYDPTTGNTVWNVPYLSNLKVGSLSALSVNTGALTVQDTLTVSSLGAIMGGQTGFNTGTGFFLGYSSTTYKFSIGNSTTGLAWDGSSLTITSAGGTFNSFSGNLVKVGVSSSGNTLFVNTPTPSIAAPLVYWNDASASTSFPYWLLDTNSKDASLSGSFAAVYWISRATSATGFIVEQAGSGGGAAKFINSNTSKELWCAPGSYAAYTPTGKGDWYCSNNVYGNGVILTFTGGHLILLPKGTYDLGDLVALDQVVLRKDINNVLFSAKKADQPRQKGVYGVVSSLRDMRDGDTFEDELPYDLWWELHETHDLAIVNALGEGQINVCGLGGDLDMWDLVVASAQPGKAMRQNNADGSADDIIRNITVAKIAEPGGVKFDSPDQVKQVACVYLSA